MITAQCIRVPATDGHLAAVFVSFDRKPSREQVLAAWQGFSGEAAGLEAALAPQRRSCSTSRTTTRPQTRLDRDAGNGMAITIGRLRPDPLFDCRFVCLSHNTVRGAAGGAVLTAELLTAEGFIQAR